MAVPIIQSSFAAGELAPGLWGRVDLEKYKSGAAMMRNFFVDYRGGASTRPGTQYVGRLRSQGALPGRLIPFQFSTAEAAVLVLDANYGCRVVSNGGYVLEGAFTVQFVQATGPSGYFEVVVPGHNFSVGDEVYFENAQGLVRTNGVSGVNGRDFTVAAVAGNYIQLDDPINPGTLTCATWTAYVANSGTLARIYTFATPWAAADLFALTYTQSADVLTVCHPNYQAQNINRYGNANWTVTPVVIGASISAPSSISSTAYNNAGGTQFSFAYAVTCVDANGQESNPTAVTVCVNSALNQNTGVCNTIFWAKNPAAVSYRVYKNSTTISTEPATAPYFWGLVANTTNLQWQDQNFAADFATVPPTYTNPFVNAQSPSPLQSPVTVQNEGFGYLAPVATITDDTGSGGAISLTANSTGAIISGTLTAAGVNYSDPSVKVAETNFTLGSGGALSWNGGYTSVSEGGGYYLYSPGSGSIVVTGLGSGYHIAYFTCQFGTAGFTGGVGVPGSGYVICNGGQLATVVLTNAPTLTATTPPPGADLTFTITDIFPGDGRAPNSRASISVGTQVENAIQPAVVAYFDQRKIYAGTNAQPDTFFASRPGQYDNFDVSLPSQSDDSIVGTIVSDQVNQIVSLTSMQSGIIALTSNGAYLISGGQPGAAFSPSTATAQSQAFSGAAPLRPLKINYDLLYLQSRGSAVRDLAYNFYVNVYTGQDVSALSSHLFSGETIIDWGYAEEPLYIVWAVRGDGILLSFTYLKEQELYGWARHDTQGQFKSVAVIAEAGRDAPYFIVWRNLNGNFVYTVERLAPRLFGANAAQNVPADPSQAWCVDCGVQYQPYYPNATLFMENNAIAGALGNPIVINPGAGYVSPLVQVIDPTGSGAEVYLNHSGGAITSIYVASAGSGYSNPQFLISDSAGHGGVISLEPQTLAVFTTNAPLSLNVGTIVRAAGGVGVITGVPSPSIFNVTLTTPIAGLLPNDTYNPLVQPLMAPQAPGTWCTAGAGTVFGGLDHLTGCTVAIVADGGALAPQKVVDGCITLPQAASAITAGQGFSCQLQTLRLDAGTPTLQGQRKSVPAVTVRTQDARGIYVGPTFNALTEMKEREYEGWGQPTAFQTKGGAGAPAVSGAPSFMVPLYYADRRTIMENYITEDGQVCVLQTYPMPATILAEVLEVDPGDQPG